MATTGDPVANLRQNNDLLNQILRGDADEDVIIDGVAKPTLSKVAAQYAANHGIYPTVSEGLAAVGDGGVFAVPGEGQDYLVLYRKTDGAGVEIARAPSSEFIWRAAETVNRIDRTVGRAIGQQGDSVPPVPILLGKNGKVPVAWRDDGLFVARWSQNTEKRLLSQTSLRDSEFLPIIIGRDNRIPLAWRNGLFVSKFSPETDQRLLGKGVVRNARTVPIVVGKGGKVVLWSQGGEIYYKGKVLGDSSEHRRPICTDGKTLKQWRRRISMLNAGASTQAKIMFSGDSWTEHSTIPQRFSDLVGSQYGIAASGWVQFNIDKPNQINGIQFYRDGWSIYDSSTTTAAAEDVPGVDAMYLYTTSSIATINVSNLVGETVDVYYTDRNGDFNLSSGSNDKRVVGGDTGHLLKATLKLQGGELRINTEGNTGRVSLAGIYVGSSQPGLVVNKCGNGGIRGSQWEKASGGIEQISADIAPDVLVWILGTNDYRDSSETPSRFKDGSKAVLEMHIRANPNIAVVFVAPAQSSASGPYPLSDYVDAAYSLTKELGIEFLNLYEFFPTKNSDASGLWFDGLHLNSAGADMLCRQILENIMKGTRHA